MRTEKEENYKEKIESERKTEKAGRCAIQTINEENKMFNETEGDGSHIFEELRKKYMKEHV